LDRWMGREQDTRIVAFRSGRFSKRLERGWPSRTVTCARDSPSRPCQQPRGNPNALPARSHPRTGEEAKSRQRRWRIWRPSKGQRRHRWPNREAGMCRALAPIFHCFSTLLKAAGRSLEPERTQGPRRQPKQQLPLWLAAHRHNEG
jgi:hypothetical protein